MYLSLGRDSTWSAYCLLPTKMLAIFAVGLQQRLEDRILDSAQIYKFI